MLSIPLLIWDTLIYLLILSISPRFGLSLSFYPFCCHDWTSSTDMSHSITIPAWAKRTLVQSMTGLLLLGTQDAIRFTFSFPTSDKCHCQAVLTNMPHDSTMYARKKRATIYSMTELLTEDAADPPRTTVSACPFGGVGGGGVGA